MILILLFRKKNERESYVAVFDYILGDIMAENGKVTTLLPAPVERVLNTLLFFEIYY